MNANDLYNDLHEAVDAIERLREEGARIHCLTNTVAQHFTANVLLACGATPSMTTALDEVAYFTDRSDAVLINLGTLDVERKASMLRTAGLCAQTSKKFVLDPVMCHVSPPRLALAREIQEFGPSIIRANMDEAKALSNAEKPAGDGCFVITGAIDKIIWSGGQMEVANGDPMLARITATGCAQGAMLAALSTKAGSPQIAGLAALLWMSIAGELAVSKAKGPGSFQTALLDNLYSLPINKIKERAKIR